MRGSIRGRGGLRRAGLTLCAGVFLWGAGCARDTVTLGRVVTLGAGDSLYRVAKDNGISLGALVRANPGLEPRRLRPGSRIRVPARRGFFHRVSLGRGQGREAFIWPVPGRINSFFGQRGRRRHEGLDLKAPRGAPVRAAEAGQVIASGWARGYGRYIKIRHSRDFVTLYAHTDANLVARGSWVRRGQVIARVGQSGNATGPHLHFEIIRNARVRDPLYYLPVGKPFGAFARL
ncbi:MAG: LysM peptidoglycan-binding domain-containing M23 family metallopeptidase [Myxococcota bacterium]